MENIELNTRGLQRILVSDEMVQELRRRAQRIASKAGPGHRVDWQPGGPASSGGRRVTRARAAVIAASAIARRREATDRNLTRAVNAGR